MIAIISQQLLLSAGDVEINPGPLASDRPHSHELISLKKDDGSKLEVTKWISAREEWDCVDFAEMLLRNDVLVKEYQNEHKGKYNFVRAVLKDWLSRDDDDPSDTAVPRTWAALAECVTDAGLDGALAKAIRDTCPSGFSVEQCSMIEVLVDSDVPESLRSLMGYYSCMLMVLQTAELSQKELHKLKLFLSGFCDDMALKSCASLELVVERLVKNLKIYIFNIDTLTACHKHQLIQRDMSQAVLQYKKQLDDFFSSTSVKQLQHSLHTKVTNPNLEPITLKLNETANVDTLNKLKKLIYHLFGNTSKALILHKVRPGCVCVTWCVPTSLVPTLREKAEQLSPQYLASKGVLELVIGLRIAPNEGHDRHSGTGEEQQTIHSSNMMIATIMKRTEIELEAVQNEKSVYEQKCDKLEEKCDKLEEKCDKLEEELEEVAKKKVDAEVKFEELEREVQICKKREQQLQRELDMAKRSSQAVISELEMKLQILEEELSESTQQKLITAAKHYALKPQSFPDTVFVDELKEIADDWRHFGSNLVSQHILKEIELQEDSPVKCLELLIIKWKELYSDGNWTDIITALEKMGKYKLANYLQQKYFSDVERVAPGKPAASPSEPAVSPIKPGATSIEPVILVGLSDWNPNVTEYGLHKSVASDPSSFWKLRKCKYKDREGKDHECKGEGTTLMVFDTGIDKDHPSFKDTNLWLPQFETEDEEFRCTCDDMTGHGTMCAGIACGGKLKGTYKNGKTFTCRGVAPGARLGIWKAYTKNEYADWRKQLKLLTKFVDKYEKPDVLVIANGDPGGFNQDTQNQIKKLDDKGIVVVCAGSNYGAKGHCIAFPARYSETICVGSNDRFCNRSGFSPVGEEMDFLALGEDIVGPKSKRCTKNSEDLSEESNASFLICHGTSFAALAVGGLICLILEVLKFYQEALPRDVKIDRQFIVKLLKFLTNRPGKPRDEKYGYGAIAEGELSHFFNDPESIIKQMKHHYKMT